MLTTGLNHQSVGFVKGRFRLVRLRARVRARARVSTKISTRVGRILNLFQGSNPMTVWCD